MVETAGGHLVATGYVINAIMAVCAMISLENVSVLLDSWETTVSQVSVSVLQSKKTVCASI